MGFFIFLMRASVNLRSRSLLGIRMVGGQDINWPSTNKIAQNRVKVFFIDKIPPQNTIS